MDISQIITSTFSNYTSQITSKELKEILYTRKYWNFEDRDTRMLDFFFEKLFSRTGVDKYIYQNILRSPNSTGVVKYPVWYTDEARISVKKLSDETFIVEIRGTNFANKFLRTFYCLDLDSVKSLDYKKLQYA